ncbi:MAG TPA: gamma-glutamyl-gamma-aminobutyrate hydrolase family protein [Candidatus Saccharimonadales bacterium]|nr:gamma-glutamyl-gamma-aminobutyrate hydrolase family protein [Candidatus Saccharimonadales bacterium]
MKPLVGIVCREVDDEARSWYPQRQGVLGAYVEAIEAAGGAPVLVPLVETASLKRIYQTLDGMLFCGGGDIDPGFYHQEIQRKLDRPSLRVDKAEMVMASWCVLDRKPVFGVCRGLQIMNVVMGGSLHQTIPSQSHAEIDHDESFKKKQFDLPVHEIHVRPQSHLRQIMGRDVVTVNSLHNQAVDIVAPGLKIAAMAPDNVIEVLEGDGNHYIMATQFHPEWLYKQDDSWLMLLSDFVSHSARQKAYKNN